MVATWRVLTLTAMLVVPSSGRVVPAPVRSSGDQWPPPVRAQIRRLREASRDLRQRLSHISTEEGAQPAFAGTWRNARVENIDAFLDQAMGVGALKRRIAAKASQTQRLYQRGKVVHLEMTDRRGTMKYVMYPDGRVVSARGFMKLPIKQCARWRSDGSLYMEERYSVPLGDAEPRPVVRSTRSVTKEDEMLVVAERTLLSGEKISMRTWFRRLPDKAT